MPARGGGATQEAERRSRTLAPATLARTGNGRYARLMEAYGAPLRFGVAQGSTRYFLGDRPLNGGDVVELCCSGGWLKGRFEWSDEGAWFHFSIELGGGGVAEHSLSIPDRALLRRA